MAQAVHRSLTTDDIESANKTNFDRRKFPSRRKTKTSPLFIGKHRGRRTQERRNGEHINSYVDRYEPHFLFMIISIAIFSCFDALFTLQLLQQGKAVEANPVMLHFIEMGIYPFLIAKMVLTSSCLLFLVAHKNFQIKTISVSKIIYAFFIAYALLIIYELVLLFIL